MNNTNGNRKITFSLLLRLLVFSVGIGFTILQLMVLLLLLIGTLFYPTGNAFVNIYPLLNITMMVIAVGGLLLPGLVLSLMEAFNAPVPPAFKRLPNRMILPNLLLLVWMVMMGAAFLFLKAVPAAQWLLPVLQIPAVLIPIFWLYRISTRSIASSDPRRNWNLLGLNLALQPIIVVTLELIALSIIAIIGLVWLATQPALLETITHQLEQIASTNFNIESMDRILVPYLEKPIVIFTILLFIAGIVPLLEELVKPMLVLRWFKQPLSDSQGFLIGLIGGSAFAIWENMSALSNIAADSWFFVVIARYGTSILHMATAAMMGWAWMKSFRDHRFFRAAFVYLLVVLLHGAWNFFTMLQAFSAFSVSTAEFPMNLTPISPYMMVSIVLFCLAVLLLGGTRIVLDERKNKKTLEPELDLQSA